MQGLRDPAVDLLAPRPVHGLPAEVREGEHRRRAVLRERVLVGEDEHEPADELSALQQRDHRGRRADGLEDRQHRRETLLDLGQTLEEQRLSLPRDDRDRDVGVERDPLQMIEQTGRVAGRVLDPELFVLGIEDEHGAADGSDRAPPEGQDRFRDLGGLGGAGEPLRDRLQRLQLVDRFLEASAAPLHAEAEGDHERAERGEEREVDEVAVGGRGAPERVQDDQRARRHRQRERDQAGPDAVVDDGDRDGGEEREQAAVARVPVGEQRHAEPAGRESDCDPVRLKPGSCE